MSSLGCEAVQEEVGRAVNVCVCVCVCVRTYKPLKLHSTYENISIVSLQ